MGEIKKLAVIITLSKQIGFDTFKDYQVVKAFDYSASFLEIFDWAKSQNKDITVGQLSFSELL